MNSNRLVLLMTLLAVYAMLSLTAAVRQEQSEVQKDAAEEIQEAIDAFNRVQDARPIPPAVLKNAVAVGVFDNLVRAAFIVGGAGGRGVISRRMPDGWTVPALYRLGGASVGAQIGGVRTDVVLVFTTHTAVEALLGHRLTIGADVSAIAGPAAATTIDTSHGILVYARHQGLFAGAALDGAVIAPDDDQNRGIYGLLARDILSGKSPSQRPPVVETFIRTLQLAGQR
jgi:lipid-binding SYLF domain-containing protein